MEIRVKRLRFGKLASRRTVEQERCHLARILRLRGRSRPRPAVSKAVGSSRKPDEFIDGDHHQL
jgi:hypothetical protein